MRLGYSTCQLEGGGGGSQHSILGKLCHLHKYLKYFRYLPTICLSCTHVSFSRYFFPIYSGLPQGPYLDSRSSFSQIKFFRAAQEATPRWYCCYHGAFSLLRNTATSRYRIIDMYTIEYWAHQSVPVYTKWNPERSF